MSNSLDSLTSLDESDDDGEFFVAMLLVVD